MKNSDAEHLEIIRDFVAESRDILEELDPNLMSLEKGLEGGDPANCDVIHDIFRGFHSIKGAASFLKMKNTATLTHHAESMLDLFRKEKAEIEPLHLDLLYRCGDKLKDMMDTIEETVSDDGQENAVAHLVAQFEESMSESGKEKKLPPTRPVNFLLPEKDRKVIEDETVRLLGSINKTLETEFLEPDVNGEILEVASRDLQGVMGHLNLLGYEDMGIAARKMSDLLERIQARTDLDHRILLNILARLLDGLKHAVNAASGGEEQDGMLLSAVLDELIVLEDGAPLSDEGEILLEETLVQLGVISREDLTRALSKQQKPIGEVLLEMEALKPEELSKGLELQSEKKQEAAAQKKDKDTMVQSIRVDLNKLDHLGNLVGELVIAENMVTHHESVSGEGFESFAKSAHVLNRISREIQDLVMSLRMIPIHATFQKLTRVIRDVSHKVNKKVEVTLSGEDTEIDKNVVENLSSPLVHIIRNAIDHGLEEPSERQAAGKQDAGSIHLAASQEGGEIVIRVKDDGRGISKTRVREKAVERGLIGPDHVFHNDSEIYELILLPGFSTASQVTELSGRGVGMDVVKQNIESMQGAVSISSEEGVGTTFSLRIPLTLSIIEGMLVRVGAAVITIPLLNIRESLVVKDHRITQAIDGSKTIKIRDELVPIIRLFEFFGFPSDYTKLTEGVLVVVEYNNKSCSLFVDEILGQRQTVIKRISNFFDEVPGITGFSILSNGDITMIMDVSQIVESQATTA